MVYLTRPYHNFAPSGEFGIVKKADERPMTQRSASGRTSCYWNLKPADPTNADLEVVLISYRGKHEYAV